MAEIVVVGFEGTHRAAEVLNELLALNTSFAIDLEDAVAVYRGRDGKLRVDTSVHPTSREGAAWGGVLGALLGGVLAAPFTAGASAALAATAIGTGALTFGVTGAVLGGDSTADLNMTYGIPEGFIKDVGGMVQPGQSAVFVLADAGDPGEVIQRFRGYGGTILRTTLPPEQAKRVQQTIAAASPAAR